jgi:hypothetical protein
VDWTVRCVISGAYAMCASRVSEASLCSGFWFEIRDGLRWDCGVAYPRNVFRVVQL